MPDGPSRRKRAGKASAPPPPEGGAATADPGLVAVGLRAGDRVRFHRHQGESWIEGTVAAREPDGSIALHDERGRRRSIPVESIQVSIVGPRGGRSWQPLAERAAADEQLDLFR